VDLNNPDFIFAGQVVAYTSSLPSNLRDVMSNNFWLFYDIKEFFKNNGGLTKANKDAVVYALSNIEAIFTTISQNPNDLTTVQINQTKQSAFQFLLQHGSWLSGQFATTQQSIFNYLITNGFSTASKNKINQLINVAIATNTTFTIDPTVNATNGQVFNSSSSLQNYLNNQSSVGSDFEYDIQQQNQKIASTKFWIGAPYNGIKVNIKQNMTNPYSVINVTSEMFGVTLFADWNQSDFSSSILNNVVTVDVYGVSSIKIFFEGIGTIYHENQHFQIKINKLTGVIISANVIP
jgi:hypothetical protein